MHCVLRWLVCWFVCWFLTLVAYCVETMAYRNVRSCNPSKGAWFLCARGLYSRSGDPSLSISPIRQPLDFDADFGGSNAQLRSGLEHTARYASGCGRTQRDTSAQQTESQRPSYKQNVVPSHTDPHFSTQTSLFLSDLSARFYRTFLGRRDNDWK